MSPYKVYILAITTFLEIVLGYAIELSGGNLGIIDGHAIPIEEAPYMVALLSYVNIPGKEYMLLCGASIVHERFLLTAAHCVLPHSSIDQTIASMGSERYQNTTNTVIGVEKFIPHDNFNKLTGDNDICLVKLKKPVPFGEKIVKITLADKNFTISAGTMVNVAGWGMIKDDFKAPLPLPLDLQGATIPVMSQQDCHDIDKKVDDTMICAGVRGRGTCYGDSGGPLVLKQHDDYIQVGIVSQGTSGCDGLDVYTRVSSFQDWISTNIAKNL